MSAPLPRRRERLFPDVPTALLVTIGALLAGGFVGFLVSDLGLLAATGIGTAIGSGGVATLAARRVADPQAVRIGLVGLDWRALPLVLCLAPAVLLASELDNLAYDWSPPMATEATGAKDTEASSGAEPDAAGATETARTAGAELSATAEPLADAAPAADEPSAPSASDETEEPPEPLLDPSDPYSVLEGVIVFVGIEPVVHEFLFRGVLQQGLVAQLGLARGVTLTALLWTMLRPVPVPTASPGRFVAAFASWVALGWLLGLVRVATGSILGSILLASVWSAVGLASLALTERMPLPGMNVDGTHLPLGVTLASVVLVGWGASRVVKLARLARGS